VANFPETSYEKSMPRRSSGLVRRKLSRLTRALWRGKSNKAKEIANLAREIRRSDLFDSAWYLRVNPDVRKAGYDPVDHYLRFGAKEGREPHPSFNTKEYVSNHPEITKERLNPLVYYLRSLGSGSVNLTESTRPVSYQDQIASRYIRNDALPIFLCSSSKRRLNLIIDTLDNNGLYGAVGTAIVFAVLFSNRTGIGLRVVTRDTPPAASNFQKLLSFQGIASATDVEFAYAAPKSELQALDVSESDIYITTSWWTTSSVRKAVPARNIVYLLQDDERIFYPCGDDQIRCAEMLSDSEICFVVNTKLLFDHLVTEGFDSIAKRGTWFEPSFSPAHYYWDENRDHSKFNFLFYARPGNLRNLYYRGLESIARAIEIGLFEESKWTFHFAGKDLTPVMLPRNIEPVLHQNLAWADYAKLVRSIDLGLCLMHSPHPSYPPLDLAASGAVVLTTAHRRKVSLDQYSANVMVSADLSVESLARGLQAAIALAADIPSRRSHYAGNGLLRDWPRSFESVLQGMQEKFA